jgi:hypothetical protein
MENGGEVELFLNAIVAKALLVAITSAGETGGWLAESGDIIVHSNQGATPFLAIY